MQHNYQTTEKTIRTICCNKYNLYNRLIELHDTITL